MSPDERAAIAQAKAETVAKLNAELVRAPASVVNGGATRAAAWKQAAHRANLVLNRGHPTLKDLEDALLQLRWAATATAQDLSTRLNGGKR